MTARVDSLLRAVARELGLEIVGAPADGEFGAVFVRDGEGRELVLKAMPDPSLAARFAQGAALSALVRSPDYPVPEYVGTGATGSAAWSLQERLPGEVPDVMTEAHARRLLELVRRHEGAAGATGDPLARMRGEVGWAVDVLGDRPELRGLAGELGRALAGHDGLELRTGDVVHGDFHHRNYLADGDDVTAYFDWEFASVGDWRIDLVNLACWGSWVPWQIPPPVCQGIVDAAHSACEPPVLALVTAYHTLRALEFNVRVHPDRVPRMVEVIDATTRPWLAG